MTNRRKLFPLAAAIFALASTFGPMTRSAEAAPTFSQRTSSIKPITAVTVDPNTNLIYAQENRGKGFYRYDPTTNIWTVRASSPINSGNNGGAAYANGKIYTIYTDNEKLMGVYNISTNKWSTLPNPLGDGTGNITAVGDILYLANGSNFFSYNIVTNTTSTLASPPFSFNDWGGLQPYNGFIYGHQGDGDAAFGRYDIANNTWTQLANVPDGAVLGSAIDPVNGIYYTYGAYDNDNLYAYDIAGGTWSIIDIPFFDVNDGGLAYISTPNYDGIYFAQGENGVGFAYYGEESFFLPNNTFNTSVNGSGFLANTNNKTALSFWGAYNQNGFGGSVSLKDSKTNVEFKSTQIMAINGSGNIVEIRGIGTINGNGSYPFRLLAQDNVPTFIGRGDPVLLDVDSGTLFYSSNYNPGDVNIVTDSTYDILVP